MKFPSIHYLLTFFSRCGDSVKFSMTELKLCNDGELPFFSGLWLNALSTVSFGGVRRFKICCLVGEFSLLFVFVVDVDVDVKLKPSVVLIGEIVRSGDNVIRCDIDVIGDVGESKLFDLALVSAIKRLACSRKRCFRSSCKRKVF